MSYTSVQLPDACSLSSEIKDIIITSDEKLTVEILVDDESILEEIYMPDVSGKITISELDRLLGNYVCGSGLEASAHPLLVRTVKINVNSVLLHTFSVMKCNTVVGVSADNFFAGNVFMHILKQKKVSSTTAKEYLTCRFTETMHTVKVFISYRSGDSVLNSSEVTLFTTSETGVKTLDVSFSAVATLFPDVDPDSILAWRVKLASEITVFLIDRNPYLLPLEFRFRNTFDVPETIISRGDATRKGETESETSTIKRMDVRFNIRRKDSFTVSSGKIFSLNDYDRWSEMFNSEDVEINFMGAWRKIIITEENAEVSLRMGSLQPVSFTFRFASKLDNNAITGESFVHWILENGKWDDDKMWLDPGHWLDS